jgi:heme exporter protein A
VRRCLGVIGHQTLLYDDLSAAENLMFYARLYDLGAPRERVRAALAEVDLEKRAGDRVRSFSRGMQQRLAIARALLHEPSILFLDEPYTGLDQHAAVMLTRWLQKLRNQRRTILLVTHDLAQGLAMADRLMIFANGRVVWQERAEQVEARRLQELYFDLVSGGR